MLALGPASSKRSGSASPTLKRELPSSAIGGSSPLNFTMTRTVNVPWATLPAASVALHLTGVEPSGNSAPDGGEQATTGLGSTLSVAVTSYLTRAPLRLVANAVIVPGSFSLGGVASPTVTVNVAVGEALPWRSTAEQLTSVLPIGKNEPDG